MFGTAVMVAAGFDHAVAKEVLWERGFTDSVTPAIRFAANRWVSEQRYAAAVASRSGDAAQSDLLNRAATFVSHLCSIESFRGSYSGSDVEFACAFLVRRFGSVA